MLGLQKFTSNRYTVRMKKYVNINHRKVGMAILTLDKVDFRTKKTTTERNIIQ